MQSIADIKISKYVDATASALNFTFERNNNTIIL